MAACLAPAIRDWTSASPQIPPAMEAPRVRAIFAILPNVPALASGAVNVAIASPAAILAANPLANFAPHSAMMVAPPALSPDSLAARASLVAMTRPITAPAMPSLFNPLAISLTPFSAINAREDRRSIDSPYSPKRARADSEIFRKLRIPSPTVPAGRVGLGTDSGKKFPVSTTGTPSTVVVLICKISIADCALTAPATASMAVAGLAVFDNSSCCNSLRYSTGIPLIECTLGFSSSIGISVCEKTLSLFARAVKVFTSPVAAPANRSDR